MFECEYSALLRWDAGLSSRSIRHQGLVRISAKCLVSRLSPYFFIIMYRKAFPRVWSS